MTQSEVLKPSPRWTIEKLQLESREGRPVNSSFLRDGAVIDKVVILRLEGSERVTDSFRINIFEESNGSWRSVIAFPIYTRRTYNIVCSDPQFAVRDTLVGSQTYVEERDRYGPRKRLKFRVGKNNQLVERASDLGITLPLRK